jgi:hypothetical protein
VTVYRQPRAGDWETVVQKIRADLSVWVAERARKSG